MKKIVLALGILVICLAATGTAYAGSLNSYEQEVISAARGSFTYDGKEYKLAQTYIDQLISYLSQDGVDLTKEQMDTVLQSINAYVEAGVEEGYLIPLNGQKDKEAVDKDTSAENSLPDTTEDNKSNHTDGSGSDNSKNVTDSSAGASSGEQLKEDGNTSGTSGNNSVQNPEAASDNSKTEIEPSADEFMGGLLSEDKDASVSSGNNTIQNPEDAGNNTNAADSAVIKNSGFNFNNTIITALSLGVFMLIGIIVTIKSNYFAQNDE